MKGNREKIFILVLEVIFLFCLTTVISTVFFNLVKDIPNRELEYNPAMPILSKIVVGEAGFNYKEILSFLGLEFLVFYLPKIGFRITRDSKGSAYLCFMPIVLWGIMAVFSYRITKMNYELPMFFVAALLQTVVSAILFIRYLDRYFSCEDEY